MEERAEQIRSKSHLIQVEREKMQMELSHKRARVELERAASASARSYEVGAGEAAPEHAGVVPASPWEVSPQPELRCAPCLPGPPEASGRLSGVSWVPREGITKGWLPSHDA